MASELVRCEGLTKVYGGSDVRALDSVSFSVSSCGVFVLIGRNGSGKTTLVRILATELEPTSGEAYVDGVDVVAQPWRVRERIAIVPQEARPLPWMTPLQSVLSYLLWRGFSYGEAKRRASEALGLLGLVDYEGTLNRMLSGGLKRKVLVAMVLASEAEVIFLDEPTTGLDPISRRDFWRVLREVARRRFTFLTTHYLEEAEQLADVVGILDRGQLVRIGSLDMLRRSMRYSYSLKLLSKPAPQLLGSVEGEVVTDEDGYVRVLTSEDEAFQLSRMLAAAGLRFTITPVSLEDMFVYLVGQGRDGSSHVQP